MNEIKHLPYEVNERSNRYHFYERLWKHRALELLTGHTEVRGLDVLDYGCGRGEALGAFWRERGESSWGRPRRSLRQFGVKVWTSLLNGNDPLAMFFHCISIIALMRPNQHV